MLLDIVIDHPAQQGAYEHLEVIHEVAVELGDGVLSGLGSLVVHIAVALGGSGLIGGHLAGEDVSEHTCCPQWGRGS